MPTCSAEPSDSPAWGALSRRSDRHARRPSKGTHRPARTRRRLDLPHPDAPTMSRWSLTVREIVRSRESTRAPLGVATDTSSRRRSSEGPSITSGAATSDRAVATAAAACCCVGTPCTLSSPVSPRLCISDISVSEISVAVTLIASSLAPVSHSRRSTSWPRRSMPAEKALRLSISFTMMDRSESTWLNAPTDWEMTPSSMAPAK
mmetsp:Transcript_13241/g.35338  ORF Transcript_13241/g.35338 Transcript_13241/m.35338 type:complete len:205 (+) Transcript_13241:1227-1841(+)